LNIIPIAAKKARQIAGAETIRIMRKILFIIQSKYQLSFCNYEYVEIIGGLPINLSEKLHDLINETALSAGQLKLLPDRHTSSFSTYEFLSAMNQDCYQSTGDILRAQDAFSLHIDESTDIVREKHLMVYVTFFDSNWQKTSTMFLALIKLERTKAQNIAEALITFFEASKIPLNKITGFTSDGASVMLGCKNGVATLLRENFGLSHLIEFHCVAHREALVLKDVLNVSFFEEYLKF